MMNKMGSLKVDESIPLSSNQMSPALPGLFDVGMKGVFRLNDDMTV